MPLSEMRYSSIETAACLLIGSHTQVDQTCGALRVCGGKAICALPEGDLSECGQPWGPLFATACTCLGGQSHADRWQMVGGELCSESYAVSLMQEYLETATWHKRLTAHLG